METVKLTTRIGPDGILKLETPVNVRDADAEVVVTIKPQKSLSQEEWEAFVNRSYGSLADDPIERGDQPPLDSRQQ